MQMVDKIISLGFSRNQKYMQRRWTTHLNHVMGCRNNGKSDKTPRRATSSLWDPAPAKLVYAGHSNQFRWAHTVMTNEINYAIWLDWMYSIPCKAWCPRAKPYNVVQRPCQRRSSEAPHQPLLPAMATWQWHDERPVACARSTCKANTHISVLKSKKREVSKMQKQASTNY
jgi:hypothetical protein